MGVKLDIHIYAVKERKGNVDRLVEKMGKKNVTIHWDTLEKPTPYERYYENCRSAWLSKRTRGLTHRVVLADDADVCKDFIQIATQCAKAFPNNIFSFCSQHVCYEDKPYQIMCSKIPMGVAMMIPIKYVDEIFGNWVVRPNDALDSHKWGLNTDETVVERFCHKHWGEIHLMTTHPNISAHLDIGGQSVLDPARGNRYSSVSFEDDVALERYKQMEVGVTI